jgi:hypothetical protein
MITTASDSTPPLGRQWARLFFWTGVITVLSGLQFVLPVPALRLLGIDITDPAGMFYARHWALMAACFGALVISASRHASGRGAIVLAAAAEKLGVALLIALAWNDPALKGLHGAAMFDGLSAAAYLAWLWLQRGKH